MSRLKLLYIVVISIIMASCTSKSPVAKIEAMEVLLSDCETTIQKIENEDFPYLVENYFLLDTTVARKNDIRKELNLIQAYLQQYETEKTNIKNEIAYSKKQLADLKDDIKLGVHDDKTQQEYLESEKKAVDKTVAKIKYFKERFESQKEIVKNLK